MKRQLFIPIACFSLLFAACPPEDDSNDNGNNCPDPAQVEADGGWMNSDTDFCATVRFRCEAGFTGFNDECGCGCINDFEETIACGARAGDTCTDSEFCAYQEGASCGWADAQAICQPRPEVCTREYMPVCGCDGNTYSNECTANANGTGILHSGACENSQPVACGARAGDTCSDNEFCDYQEGASCGWADAQATCQPRPEVCTREYMPVCGCDGNTYSNACSANASGTGILHSGACEASPIE